MSLSNLTIGGWVLLGWCIFYFLVAVVDDHAPRSQAKPSGSAEYAILAISLASLLYLLVMP